MLNMIRARRLETIIVDDDTCARFESWYQRSQDVEGVGLREVVEDPAEIVY